MKKLIAYSLAEILIVVAIIGTISAMTMPVLRSNVAAREAFTGTSKAYSTLSSVVRMLEREKGPIKYWYMDKDFVKNSLTPKLVTICSGAGCFTDVGEREHWSSWEKFVTADGILWAYKTSSQCNLSDGTYAKKGCAFFEVDINASKGPNEEGKDLFGFVVTKDGAFPYGGCPECSGGCVSKKGWGCTAEILKKGKL